MYNVCAATYTSKGAFRDDAKATDGAEDEKA